MKSIIYSLFFAALFFGYNLSAQNYVPCASHQYLKYLDAKNPGMEQAVKDLSEQAKNFKRTRAGVITIPVVVHIVYYNAAQNLSDNYINAQIDMLNKSYLRQNSDTTNLRTEFASRVGKANIQFMLVDVKRVQTTVNGFEMTNGQNNTADAVKYTNAGGSNAVDPARRLNIWVCNLTIQGGELLGYAYPPAGLANWGNWGMQIGDALDGVVIDYMAFGGTSQKPKNASFQGKTAVHEVGHYLGLRHIWGDDNGACHGQQGFEDDGIADTPEQGDQSNFNCNKNANSCNEGAGDMKDMVENYMDYSSETCQNSFTLGQIALMESVLSNQRQLLKIPTSIASYDDISSNVIVYPNPTNNGILNVSIINLDYQNASISIYNAFGQMVKTMEINQNNSNENIDVSGFAKGFYVVKTNVDGKYINTQKVLIQ
ncbi:MAG: T9SS type A sorting domain-containing protein [Chitinophagaceae bacterium]|nr:MAG: Pregnancy-associated plasma protein-A [Bacteroidetes bacterium OLB11]MCC6447411.1 T9SS type A sorting domain-containing protein [Chitinophagaceae bacterium]HMN32572.1 zinc-dependent metalloprotease [Chitinophagaceae bacterium]